MRGTVAWRGSSFGSCPAECRPFYSHSKIASPFRGGLLFVDFVESSLTIAVSGVVAGLVGYFFGMRTARRQRLHEIKQRTYVEMLTPIQELVEIFGWIHDFRTLDFADDDKFVGHLIRLVVPPFSLAD